jgi:hypothetical protein
MRQHASLFQRNDLLDRGDDINPAADNYVRLLFG